MTVEDLELPVETRGPRLELSRRKGRPVPDRPPLFDTKPTRWAGPMSAYHHILGQVEGFDPLPAGVAGTMASRRARSAPSTDSPEGRAMHSDLQNARRLARSAPVPSDEEVERFRTLIPDEATYEAHTGEMHPFPPRDPVPGEAGYFPSAEAWMAQLAPSDSLRVTRVLHAYRSLGEEGRERLASFATALAQTPEEDQGRLVNIAAPPSLVDLVGRRGTIEARPGGVPVVVFEDLDTPSSLETMVSGTLWDIFGRAQVQPPADIVPRFLTLLREPLRSGLAARTHRVNRLVMILTNHIPPVGLAPIRQQLRQLVNAAEEEREMRGDGEEGRATPVPDALLPARRLEAIRRNVAMFMGPIWEAEQLGTFPDVHGEFAAFLDEVVEGRRAPDQPAIVRAMALRVRGVLNAPRLATTTEPRLRTMVSYILGQLLPSTAQPTLSAPPEFVAECSRYLAPLELLLERPDLSFNQTIIAMLYRVRQEGGLTPQSLLAEREAVYRPTVREIVAYLQIPPAQAGREGISLVRNLVVAMLNPDNHVGAFSVPALTPHQRKVARARIKARLKEHEDRPRPTAYDQLLGDE